MRVRFRPFRGAAAGFTLLLSPLAACSGPAERLPAIAAPGTPAPDAPSHIVFFDAGSSSITADGVMVLNRALRYYARHRPSRVTVVGHADRSGHDGPNATLSAERAEAVRRYLVERGMAGGVMVARAVGERDGLVSTPDGAAEAQNRRAEIYMRGEAAAEPKEGGRGRGT